MMSRNGRAEHGACDQNCATFIALRNRRGGAGPE